ncbi:MAG: twin-arginine translocase TatA/TatE family subunit, partial [Propionicimonas sp.]|nr:twin-arginine translocase TatA/TatE family subunit [Propionicimonas sp.]
MIDFNAAEILVLAVLAVIIFGPEKLPEFARKLGRVFNYLRRIANDARGQLREQLGPEFDDLHLSDLTPRGLSTRLLGEDATRDLAEAGRSASGAAATLGATIRAEADPSRGTG